MVNNFTFDYFFSVLTRPSIKTNGLKTVSLSVVKEIIKSAYPKQTNFELVDREYLLPNDGLIDKICRYYWYPYMKYKGLEYGKNYDCDNFSFSLCNLVQELKKGICFGMCHYSWYDIDTKEYKAHAVNCYINDKEQFRIIEPQGGVAKTLPADNDLNFVYMQGIL